MTRQVYRVVCQVVSPATAARKYNTAVKNKVWIIIKHPDKDLLGKISTYGHDIAFRFPEGTKHIDYYLLPKG